VTRICLHLLVVVTRFTFVKGVSGSQASVSVLWTSDLLQGIVQCLDSLPNSAGHFCQGEGEGDTSHAHAHESCGHGAAFGPARPNMRPAHHTSAPPAHG